MNLSQISFKWINQTLKNYVSNDLIVNHNHYNSNPTESSEYVNNAFIIAQQFKII